MFGPNEAGKTTSLTAIEDMLFGIPERSRYSFRHGYDAMRVGAMLENDGHCFEFQRRKTRRDMILGPDGDPLPGDEQLLAPFLVCCVSTGHVGSVSIPATVLTTVVPTEATASIRLRQHVGRESPSKPAPFSTASAQSRRTAIPASTAAVRGIADIHRE